jgi:hypothetical protein
MARPPVLLVKVEPLGITQFDDGRRRKGKTMALRIFENAAMALPETAFTLRSARPRSFQSLSFANIIALFWARPEKPMPEIAIQDSTASFSFSKK